MRSHFMLGLCAATGAAGLIADSGRAGSLIAADIATDPAYDDGWDPGDNGGFGFSAWNFDGTYASPIQHAMDDGSAIQNQLGRAWTIYNPDAPPATGTDISTAGRGFPALSTGQRLRVVIDNPTQRQFFRGYTIRLNSGGSSTCYGGGCTPGTTPVTKFAVGTFEYFTNGEWYATPGGFSENIFDTETDGGVQIDFTLTSASTLEILMLPLDNPGLAETASATLTNPATERIDWIEFELYNTDSDFHPKVIADPQATDFYIRELEIEQVPEPGASILWAVGGTVLLLVRRKSLARTTRAYG